MAQQKPAPKLSPLAQCRVNEQAAVDSLVEKIAESDKLATANKQLKDDNAELAKKYEELRTAAKDVLGYTQTLDGQYKKMLDDYRNLLADYKGALERQSASDWAHAANAANSDRQQRFNNALAIYQAMPKYQPPQTINVNVSDCTRLPALCVGK